MNLPKICWDTENNNNNNHIYNFTEMPVKGGNSSTVVAHWTADQQGRAINPAPGAWSF